MLTILQGDALEKLRELPDESAQCCVTSPPYWGLRDYGTAEWEGGDQECNHQAGSFYGTKNDTNAGAIRGGPFLSSCGKCGAKRIDSQIGLEETPDAYVAKMVEVFREVRRVLRNDGTLWLNLGDSYASDTKGSGGGWANDPNNYAFSAQKFSPRNCNHGIKSKDLCGIPWRVAFALRADGWYLRSDIIWHKPNPMPESVTDRPTKSHEYLFLLSKRERYFYDADAIKEQAAQSSGGWQARQRRGELSSQTFACPDRMDKGVLQGINCHEEIRNKRSVWTVPTNPYSEAHFATYPPDLIKPCILAGTKAGDTVLDPFAGSGTTGMVAIELGRKAVLIELNPDYIPLIEQRCATTPGFAL